MKRKMKLFLSLLFSTILLVTVFTLPGTAAMAEEGDNVTDSNGGFYDADGNELEDPAGADVCYDSDGNVIPCPTDEEENESDGEDDSDSSDKPVPPGQMVRRGLSGPIAEVGDGYIVIETNFGMVKVYTDEEVDESMIGQRVAVKLTNRERTRGEDEPVDDETGEEGDEPPAEGEDEGTDDSESGAYYREADAEQFKMIPTRATKEHKWGTVESTEEGCFFVDEEGNQIPTECGDSGDDDVIGLVGTEDGDDEDGAPVLLGTEQTSRIQTRLQERLALAEEEGDAKVMERLQTQLARYEEKQLERQEKKDARVAERAEKAKGNQDKGNSDKEKGNSGSQSQGNSGGNKKDK